MAGRVTALAVLLLEAADKFTAPVTVRGEGGFSGKSYRTVYDSVLEEALTLGATAKAASSGRRLGGNRLVDGWGSTQSCREKRKALLREIELLHVFGAVPRSSSNHESAMAPLLRACQVWYRPASADPLRRSARFRCFYFILFVSGLECHVKQSGPILNGINLHVRTGCDPLSFLVEPSECIGHGPWFRSTPAVPSRVGLW